MVLHRMVMHGIALFQSSQLFHIISNDEAQEKSAGLAEKVSGDKSAETFLFILFPPTSDIISRRNFYIISPRTSSPPLLQMAAVSLANKQLLER